jgi:hypothetical protein
MKKIIFFIPIFFLFFNQSFFQEAHAEMYQWTDSDGVVHFSNVDVTKNDKVQIDTSEEVESDYDPVAAEAEALEKQAAFNEEKRQQLIAKELQLKEVEARQILQKQIVHKVPPIIDETYSDHTEINETYSNHTENHNTVKVIKKTNIIIEDSESQKQAIEEDKKAKARHKFGNQMTDSEWEREKARQKRFNR